MFYIFKYKYLKYLKKYNKYFNLNKEKKIIHYNPINDNKDSKIF